MYRLESPASAAIISAKAASACPSRNRKSGRRVGARPPRGAFEHSCHSLIPRQRSPAPSSSSSSWPARWASGDGYRRSRAASARIRRRLPFLALVFADGGYQGEVATTETRARSGGHDTKVHPVSARHVQPENICPLFVRQSSSPDHRHVRSKPDAAGWPANPRISGPFLPTGQSSHFRVVTPGSRSWRRTPVASLVAVRRVG